MIHSLNTLSWRGAQLKKLQEQIYLYIFYKVMRPGHEANYSPSRNTEVKDEWKYTFTPSYVFVAWYLVKHTDKFILP
jgi:hypothetical protein